MGPLLSLVEVESCPAEDDLMTMPYEILDKVLEVKCTRTSVHQSDVVYREARLERSILEESVEDDIRVGILLQLYHDADTLHGCLVVDI